MKRVIITRYFGILALLLLIMGINAHAQEKKPSYKSLVPAYSFPNTLEEQEEALKTNPLLLRFHESREKLSDDPYRPIYHYVNPEGRLNDPNGLCFWQGKWHLFYQAYPPEDPRQHWGHAISDDLIHWQDLPLAIYPDPEDKCFSGSTMVEDDRVIAIYHGIQQGTMVAVSSDPLLLNWEKVTGKAVIPLPKQGEELPYNVFDPCIWKQGDYYYALTAGRHFTGPDGKSVRAEFLHRSKDLATWEYMHPFLENDGYGLVGDDGACPYFWPIGVNNEKHILAHFSHMSGGKYLIGDYDTERQKFIVTNGSDFNFGSVTPGGVHAPSAYPDGKGGVVVIFNMNEGKPTVGWNRLMSLPRRLTLNTEGNFNPLYIEPAGDIKSMRRDSVTVQTMKLPANKEIILEGVQGNAIEIVAEIAPQKDQTIELNVLRSSGSEEVTRIICMRNRGYRRGRVPCMISLDATRSSLASDVGLRPPENAQVELANDEPLKLRIFIDKSILEVFINGKQCIAMRVYPERDDSIGVSLRSQGKDAELTSLVAYQMGNIYK
jgi:beta-fructofuranosidase